MRLSRRAAPLGLLVALAATAPPARAQQGAEAAVMRTVRRLFDGMRAGDSAMIRSAFHPKALLLSTVARDGTPAFAVDSIDGFVRAAGRPHPAVWDERIANEKVHVDGNLAFVWTDYTFYAGDKLSHCGIDSFQLMKAADGWKIITLADTRRQANCPQLPPGR